MATHHPVFLSNPTPPNLGRPVTSIDQLEEKLVIQEQDGDFIAPRGKRKKRVNFHPPRIPLSWTLEKTILTYCPISWGEHFSKCLPELQHADRFLDTEDKIVPRKDRIFRPFYLCSIDQIKVVIIGPEPYEKSCPKGVDYADGLAFSTNRSCSKNHVGTDNIFREVKKSFPGVETPLTGDLSSWAKQGVLLLNRCLTTRPGEKKAHQGVWDGFFHRTLLYIKENAPKTIFVLWGAEPKKAREFLTGSTILESDNPAANRRTSSFVNSDHFCAINTFLQANNRTPIDWTIH